MKDLIRKLHYKNVTFVHRDFHVSNLMMVKNKIAVIDTQDALIGNRGTSIRLTTASNCIHKQLMEVI